MREFRQLATAVLCLAWLAGPAVSAESTPTPPQLPRTVRPQPSHRRNEPMYLAHIVEELARDRGESVEAVAAATSATATAFFRLPA